MASWSLLISVRWTPKVLFYKGDAHGRLMIQWPTGIFVRSLPRYWLKILYLCLSQPLRLYINYKILGVPTEKAMAPHSSTLPGKSHGRGSLVGCSPWGRWESDTTERLHFHFSLSCIGEGNGNPLQCSCLENPRDRGAWWAANYGVAQSWPRLKWLSSRSRSAHMCLEYALYWPIVQGCRDGITVVVIWETWLSQAIVESYFTSIAMLTFS